MTTPTPSLTMSRTMPAIILHLEGLTVLIGAIILYAHLRGNAWLFALLLFTPDVFMLGYLRDARLGSVIYNIGHTYILTGSLLLLALIADSPLGVQLALIWFAHIGLDRTMGYGLKYPTQFKDTHFNRA